MSIDKSFENIGLLPHHQNLHINRLANSNSPHIPEKPLAKANQNLVNLPLREITIKLDNRSLEKCQLYH